MMDAAANDDHEALRLMFMRLMRFMVHDEFGDGDDEDVDVDDTTDDVTMTMIWFDDEIEDKSFLLYRACLCQT